MTDPNRIGDGPIDPKVHGVMNDIARIVDETLNGTPLPARRRNGFILMVFPFDDHEGRCNYISNAARDDMKVLLREQLARFEGMPEARGRA